MRDKMKLMCRIFGHKPVQIVELMGRTYGYKPTQIGEEYSYFCERCLEDLVQDDKGKWVINKDVKTEEWGKMYRNCKKDK